MNARSLFGMFRMLVPLAVMICSSLRADVVYPPTEHDISSRPRSIQDIAAIRATWGAFVEAIVRGDLKDASTFVVPEKRDQFTSSAGRAKVVAAAELLSKVKDMPCHINSDVSVICIATMTSQNGNLEDIQLPAVKRDGVWYITW